MTTRFARIAFAVALPALLVAGAPLPPDLLSGLVWRNVGPFRGGRVSAASGVIGQPGTFYIGLPEGGVWKTTSGGSTWWPVFDSVRGVSSIGAIAVAPSNGGVIYAGTGDLFTSVFPDPRDGMYRSSDSGKTWTHLGLDSTLRITAILVDPRNANVVLAAAMGNQRRRNTSRGVYRSTDGGASWTHALSISDTTAVSALAAAYDRPDVIYATSRVWWAAPPPPAGTAPVPPPNGPPPTGAGVFKSTDGGASWKELTGVPRFSGRARIAVAQGTNAQRVYLITGGGLFRSDDGGGNWRRMAADDDRIRNGQGGYNCGVYVDAKDPDVVYTFNTTAYKSTDGGKTFVGFKGAPGGDDPQVGWIDPTDGHRILLGYDQGAIVSYDGGGSWSSWFNQSSEQVYRLAVDKSFPYWIYATQQDAGAIRTRVRGDNGAVGPFDWSGVNAWEWGTIVVDPLDNDIVYSSGNGINRVVMTSGQWSTISPAADPMLRLRGGSLEPILFAPWDPHELIAAYQLVMSTTDGGAHWKQLSHDLTYPAGVTPPADTAKPAPHTRRVSIEALAASPVAKGELWAGTGNGLIKLTRDHGKSWSDVSIPGFGASDNPAVQWISASPFRAGTAYVVVTANDSTLVFPPLAYRTRDFGAHWEKIADGLPSGMDLTVIRADPVREGLLYAAATKGIYVSFDDGEHWQSLQQNLPLAEVRDVLVAGSDLIVGTYGRGIWVMDGASVLRQMTPGIASEPVHFFRPDTAVRVRRNVNFDTPIPPEVPQAPNALDGAIIYYSLATKPAGEITLDVLDARGALVRHMSSVAAPQVKEAARAPMAPYWIAPPEALPAERGTNRTHWDLRVDAPPALIHDFEINASPWRTPPSPESPLAPPGTYTLKLSVDGKTYQTSLVVVNDPRSRASAKDLAVQFEFERQIMATMAVAREAFQQAWAMSAALDSIRVADTTSAAAKSLAAFRARVDSLEGDPDEERSYFSAEPDPPPANFHGLNEWLAQVLIVESYGDFAPTESIRAGYGAACTTLAASLAKWQALNAKDVPALAAELERVGMKAPPAAKGVTAPKC